MVNLPLLPYDKRHKRVIYAARDAMGIRPLFYGYTAENQLLLLLRMKILIAFCEKSLSVSSWALLQWRRNQTIL